MTKKEEVKRIRKAAYYISRWRKNRPSVEENGNAYDTEYSCMALRDVNLSTVKYGNLYGMQLRPSCIQGLNGDFTKQTQLHRQLLIELYALLVENGEINKIV